MLITAEGIICAEPKVRTQDLIKLLIEHRGDGLVIASGVQSQLEIYESLNAATAPTFRSWWNLIGYGDDIQFVRFLTHREVEQLYPFSAFTLRWIAIESTEGTLGPLTLAAKCLKLLWYGEA